MSNVWQDCISEELQAVEELIRSDLESPEPELTEMCQYVISAGGKRLRPIMCILAYRALGGKDPNIPVRIGSAFEIIHSATLIHDDINDQGEIRRGRKTLHKQYTISKAIIAGDFMFSMGFRLINKEAPAIVDFMVEAATAMGAGEFVQKDYEHTAAVTEEDYIRIITGKTAKLFEASAKSGAVMACRDPELIEAVGEYSHNIGLAFQIVDDTLDVTGVIGNTGKGVGLDIIEGKPTLPTIYAMQDPEYGAEIKALFEKTDIGTEDVVKALELIKRTDSVDRCIERAQVYVEKAKASIACLADSEYKRSMLDLADFITSRDR